MTLEEARARIGDRVIYSSHPGEADEGVITAVAEPYVFVNYGRGQGSQATRPENLTLMRGGSAAEHVRLNMAGRDSRSPVPRSTARLKAMSAPQAAACTSLEVTPAPPAAANAAETVAAAAAHFAETWAELLLSLPDEYACEMNCAEAEAVAGLYRALDDTLTAAAIIAAHALYDREGDEHWLGETGGRP